MRVQRSSVSSPSVLSITMTDMLNLSSCYMSNRGLSSVRLVHPRHALALRHLNLSPLCIASVQTTSTVKLVLLNTDLRAVTPHSFNLSLCAAHRICGYERRNGDHFGLLPSTWTYPAISGEPSGAYSLTLQTVLRTIFTADAGSVRANTRLTPITVNYS